MVTALLSTRHNETNYYNNIISNFTSMILN